MYRIGTTSYILPDEILPNVAYLGPQVDDIELVLFETDEYGSNLPDATLCRQLVELAARHHLTYTVHLPLDLRLADGGHDTHISLVKARRVVEATRPLAPFAYTVHLDARALLAGMPLAEWQAGARGALQIVSDWLDDPRQLCVENLERWDPAAYAPLIDELSISRTVDIGHLWLMGVDPAPHLAEWLPQARIVHLHGIGERDHQSLALTPHERLDPAVRAMNELFDGVLTLEVFNQDDLAGSLAALAASQARLGRGGQS